MATLLALSGCYYKEGVRNTETGLFQTTFEPDIKLNEPFDLDKRKQLIFVEVISSRYPDADMTTYIEHYTKQLKRINYFDEFLNYEELQIALIKNDLSEQIPSLKGKIAVSNAAKLYKPFLWLTIDLTPPDADVIGTYRLTFVDPLSLKDLLIVETTPGFWWGMTPEAMQFPMFNALIQYIRENSKSYK